MSTSVSSSLISCRTAKDGRGVDVLLSRPCTEAVSRLSAEREVLRKLLQHYSQRHALH